MAAKKTTNGYIGRALKRVEDPRLIQGIATYVDDLILPGMLHTAILRSPYAHARIQAIHTEAARALPGVVGVFVGADVNKACGVVPCVALMPGQKAPRPHDMRHGAARGKRGGDRQGCSDTVHWSVLPMGGFLWA